MAQLGEFHSVRVGYALYLRRWFDGLTATTHAVSEFCAKSFESCVAYAPDRLIDSIEDVLAAYRKNENPGQPGARSLTPVVLVAMSKDWIPAGGDWGGQIGERMIVALDDAPDASHYGYKQARAEVRTQVCIVASDSNSARSLAAQFCMFIARPSNRHFSAPFEFGQYKLAMPVMLETTDIQFMDAKLEQKSLTALYADVTLRVTIPYLDAPKRGEPTDGSGRKPEGYPRVQLVGVENINARLKSEVSAAGLRRLDWG